MGKDTKIEWATHTFNPWYGCTKVSPGCSNCYAENMMDNRFKLAKWGKGKPRRRTKEQKWKEVLLWNKEAKKTRQRFKVFCASLGDVFDSEVENSWRLDLWDLIEQTPYLDWLILTKRPENILDMMPTAWIEDAFPRHVWLGTSVENQEMARVRIPLLMDTPAHTRFLSCEPLLEQIHIQAYLHTGEIHWVICGGESSSMNSRPLNPHWATRLRDQCKNYKVPFFFKQWGDWRPVVKSDRHWGDIKSKPIDIHGREKGLDEAFDPVSGDALVVRIGKQNTGRILDGSLYNEFPDRERLKFKLIIKQTIPKLSID